MIKLKDILLEGISNKEIKDIVSKVYPYIVKKLGGRAVKIEVHKVNPYSIVWVGEKEFYRYFLKFLKGYFYSLHHPMLESLGFYLWYVI